MLHKDLGWGGQPVVSDVSSGVPGAGSPGLLDANLDREEIGV